MKLPVFEVEQWMTDYEGKAIYNLTDTCIAPLSLDELCGLPHQLSLADFKLDYGDITGKSELKKEILKLYQTGDIEHITMTQGCLQANELVMNTLLDYGDVVITFIPGYQQFIEIPKSIGCEVKTIELLEETDWLPNEDIFSLIEDLKPKMIIINNPNNPTGTWFKLGFLEKFVEASKKNQTYILADEVYQGLSQEEIKISDIYEYGISTSSLSKVYSLAGLRLGWIKANPKLIHLFNIRRDYSIISLGPLVETLGTIALLNKEDILKRNQKIVETNKEIVSFWLEQNKQFHCHIPEVGTVGFLHYESNLPSKTLSQDLLEKTGVFFVPGSCFGFEHYLRLGFTTTPENMKTGLQQLSNYLKDDSSLGMV